MQYATLPVGRSPEPSKVAFGMDMMMAAMVAAVAGQIGLSIPVIEKIRQENPMLYAALIGATALTGKEALSPPQLDPPPQQQQLVPGALIPPGFMV